MRRFVEENPDSPLMARHIDLFSKGCLCGRPVNVEEVVKNGKREYWRDPKTGMIRKLNNKETR